MITNDASVSKGMNSWSLTIFAPANSVRFPLDDYTIFLSFQSR